MKKIGSEAGPLGSVTTMSAGLEDSIVDGECNVSMKVRPNTGAPEQRVSGVPHSDHDSTLMTNAPDLGD